MALEERFTYVVMPRRPIRNLIKGKNIIKETTLLLSKSEVSECLKHGRVYRKFYLESTGMERVIPSNLDRLHRSNHISEADYNNLKDKGEKTVSGLSTDSLGTVTPESEQHEENDVEIVDNVTEDEIEVVEEPVVEKKAGEEQLSTDNELISTGSEDIDDSENAETDDIPEESNVEISDVTDCKTSTSRSKKKRNKHRNNNSEASPVPKTAE